MRILFLLLFPLFLTAQNNVRYIKELNKIAKDYEKIEDEFYPDLNRYEPKQQVAPFSSLFNGAGIIGGDTWERDLYPRMFMNGEKYLISRVNQNGGWHFTNKVVFKIDGSVFETVAIDCSRTTSVLGGKPSTLEVCTHELTDELYKTLGSVKDIKARIYGEETYHELKINLKQWSQHWNFYTLMTRLGKFESK